MVYHYLASLPTEVMPLSEVIGARYRAVRMTNTAVIRILRHYVYELLPAHCPVKPLNILDYRPLELFGRAGLHSVPRMQAKPLYFFFHFMYNPRYMGNINYNNISRRNVAIWIPKGGRKLVYRRASNGAYLPIGSYQKYQMYDYDHNMRRSPVIWAMQVFTLEGGQVLYPPLPGNHPHKATPWSIVKLIRL